MSSSTGTGSSGTCTRHLSTEDQLHERLWVLVNSLMHLGLGALEHAHEFLIEGRVLKDSSTELGEVGVGSHSEHLLHAIGVHTFWKLSTVAAFVLTFTSISTSTSTRLSSSRLSSTRL